LLIIQPVPELHSSRGGIVNPAKQKGEKNLCGFGEWSGWCLILVMAQIFFLLSPLNV